MAIIWADFPSGQRGLYGTNVANMLNGIWADSHSALLSADPDPTIGDAGVVLKTDPTSGDNWRAARIALPAEVTTLGVGVRLWMGQLPTGATMYPYISFRDNTNTGILTVKVSTTGQLVAYSGGNHDGTGGTLLQASAPVLTANAFRHIEFKCTKGAGTGALIIKTEGSTIVLNLSGLTLSANNIAQVVFGTQGPADPAMTAFWKDMVFWDTLGSEANDFQGAVAVYDLYADADVSLNWDPSTGALGYPLIVDNFPGNTLTASGAISAGEQVRIDNTYYQFTAGSVNAGAPAGTAGNPWLVALGGSVAIALSNLFSAIGASGIAGTDYSTALTAHATVDANGFTATAVSVTAKLQTASAIVTTETGANLAWVSGTLVLGPTDPSYIEADATPPAAAVFSLTNLPPDVTSVRALLPIFRGQKTDGGDCNVQSGLSPDNATWVNGADEPMTTAFTYYWSPIHTSPVTAAPWTPGEVNGAFVRVNRTI